MQPHEISDALTEGLSRERIRELRDSYNIWMKADSWQHFSSVLKEQYDLRMQALVSSPLKTLDESLAQEYMKGECAALLIISELLPKLSAYLDDLLKLGEAYDNSSGQDPSDE